MRPSELAKWRQKQGLTQKELAEKLGVAENTVFRWEKAMRAIPPFLHLTLECMERKGGKDKTKGIQKGKGVKK